MAGTGGNPFWDFSLAVYGRDGVEAACLALQDRHDLDVNLLLFCCWAGCRGHALSADDIGTLRKAVAPWRARAVEPLRNVRRWLKTQAVAPAALAEPLRARIKADELAAEAVEQRLLVETVPVGAGDGGPALAAANLAAYLGDLELVPDDRDAADLAALVRGCFPTLSRAEAAHYVAG